MSYNSSKEYFITFKVDNQYQRMIKIEQGNDDSLYIKWSLSLAKNKDGQYNHRSYRSYHSKYDSIHRGYRSHMKGCGGRDDINSGVDRSGNIIDSIVYHKTFITEWDKGILGFGFNEPYGTVVINALTGEDIVFESSDYNKLKITFFSMKRKDLLEKDYDNATCRLLKFNNYDLIAVFLNNHKSSPATT